MPAGRARRGRRLAEDARPRAARSGSIARGTPSSVSSSLVPVEPVGCRRERARGVGRVGGVHARRRVSFHRSQVSTVPKASSPRSARARAPGTWSSSQRDLGAGEVGVEHEARSSRRTSGLEPAAFSAVADRRGAPALPHDRAVDGRPVARSHTIVVSRWFVMPMAATSAPADAAPRRRACAAAVSVVDQISSGSCSTQPGLREVLRQLGVAARRARARPRRRPARWSRWCPGRARGRSGAPRSRPAHRPSALLARSGRSVMTTLDAEVDEAADGGRVVHRPDAERHPRAARAAPPSSRVDQALVQSRAWSRRARCASSSSRLAARRPARQRRRE